MKQFTKLMAMLLFTAATQYSCINDADVAIPDKTQSDSNGNVALFLEIPNVPASRSAESSGVTEEGSKEEYAVHTPLVVKTIIRLQEKSQIHRFFKINVTIRMEVHKSLYIIRYKYSTLFIVL